MSILATRAVGRLVDELKMKSCTFAYCRLGSSYQKYTSLFYTAEAATILNALNGPEFRCNHPRGAHAEKAGGRDAGGEFASAKAAAYPLQLCWVLARAFTLARTGSADPIAVMRSAGLWS